MQRLRAVAALTGALALAGCSAKPQIVIANADQVVIAAGSPKAAASLANTQCGRFNRDTRYDKANEDTHWFTCTKSMRQATAAKEPSAKSLAEPTWSPPPMPSSTEPALKTPEPEKHAAEPKKRAAKKAPKGDYWVQVASRRKRTEAESAVRRIMNMNSDLLGEQSFAVVKANIPNAGTYYRSRVGPFASFSNARKVCKSLKSRRQDCLVIIR